VKKLLVIEDELEIRRIIRTQLKRMEIEILEAGGKTDALAILAASPPDAVICDIKMKDSNGIEILEIIHRDHPRLPVIMLTGFIDKLYYDQVRDAGGFDLITKPVRREKLMETVENAFQSGQSGKPWM
jgi:DNA-binding NtrC family response regulator